MKSMNSQASDALAPGVDSIIGEYSRIPQTRLGRLPSHSLLHTLPYVPLFTRAPTASAALGPPELLFVASPDGVLWAPIAEPCQQEHRYRGGGNEPDGKNRPRQPRKDPFDSTYDFGCT